MMKKILLALFIPISFGLVGTAQTYTLTTEGGTSYTGGTTFSTGIAAITFAIQNSNTFPIAITQVDVYWRIANNNSQGNLWYSPTSLGGAPTIATPEWTMIKDFAQLVAVPADGIYPTITGINFIVPANTTYRFAVQQSPTGRYSGSATVFPTPNNFVVNGVTLHTGDAQQGGMNVGYGGNGTAPGSNPRYFTGKVIFEQASNLPVTLVNFIGNKEAAGNQLRWNTVTEQNNKGFDIERSVDGKIFSSIGFVNSKADNGNSNHVINYSFVDNKTRTSTYYYRIRQIDIDDKSTVSNTIIIKGERPQVLTIGSFYPNPVQENLNIVIDAPLKENISLIIFDLNGKQFIKKQVSVESGINSIPLKVNHLPAGNYTLSLVTKLTSEGSTIRFVKQ